MTPMISVSNKEVREFWEAHPVVAREAATEPGTPEYFRRVDALREAPNCEPFPLSDKIHGYSQSAGKQVLDVGCGHGYVLSHYARNGADVHGIDLTQRAIDLTRKRFQIEGLMGEFRLTDGDHIPYSANSFDIVCSMGVLHHISDPRPMIKEIHRVLRPGGTFILMLYHKNSFRNYVTFRWRQWFGPACYRGKSMDQIRNMNDGIDCPLAVVYDRPSVRKLLEPMFIDLTFFVNKLSYEEIFLFLPFTGWISRLLPSPSESFLARHWGWNLYVSARKT